MSRYLPIELIVLAMDSNKTDSSCIWCLRPSIPTELNQEKAVPRALTFVDEGMDQRCDQFRNKPDVAGILTVGGLRDASAQQRQLRPVTMVYRSTSIARTQWSPNSANPNANSPGETPSTTGRGSDSATNAAGNSGQGFSQGNRPVNHAFSPGFSQATTAVESFNGVVQRPTYQQLQNPSGAYQLSHVGFSQPASVAPNNYLGAEYNSWNNLQAPPANLDSFESFNRFQTIVQA